MYSMKFFLRTAVAFPLGLIVMISTTFAQQKLNDASFQKTLDESYENTIAVKNKQNEQEQKKATDKMIVSFQQSIDAMSSAILKGLQKDLELSEQQLKELEQKYPYKKAAFDLPADIKEVPFPITALTIAAKTDAQAMYKSYYDKLDSKQNQLREFAQKNNLYQEIYDKEGTAGLEKKAAAEAGKNPIVKQMGGAEKLMNMTDAERKAAAEKMKADIKQNPGMLYSSGADPGMRDIQQKVMSDPEYANRFSKMSEAEKQTEIRKYMTLKPQVGDPNAVYTNNPQSKKTTTDLERSREVNELLARAQKLVEQTSATNSRMTTISNNTIEELRLALASWEGNTMKTIPIVELGEYGHDRDPELVQAMEITRKYASYYIENLEITFRTICWKQYKNGLQSAMMEINNYAANYIWEQGKDIQLFNGTYKDPKIAGAVLGYYDLARDLAKLSGGITSSAASAQKRFEGIL